LWKYNQINLPVIISTELGKNYSTEQIIKETIVASDGTNYFDLYTSFWMNPMNEDELGEFYQMLETYNNYAMYGWMAAYTFAEGLRNLEEDLSWNSYIKALEKQPIDIPLTGTVNFGSGQRFGVEVMSFLKFQVSDYFYWNQIDEYRNYEELLSK
jgi:branched-chain amino acid transport system substrate-binding protein